MTLLETFFEGAGPAGRHKSPCLLQRRRSLPPPILSEVPSLAGEQQQPRDSGGTMATISATAKAAAGREIAEDFRVLQSAAV